MILKTLLSTLFSLLVILLLIFYWLAPFRNLEFEVKTTNSNFSLSNLGTKNFQFYENMRYPDSKISYKIDNCNLQKENDMDRAFQIVSEKTILSFFPVNQNEEISVTCDNKNKLEGGLFIAGEGGPVNITASGEFKVITYGKILLIKDSNCPTPNIAIHELLHTLGFNHSDNSKNIIYYISDCSQTIGDDQINLIDTLYAIPSYPDLSFEDLSATMSGRYLDVNMSIRNNGLTKSGPAIVEIYANKNLIKEVNLDSLEIGNGIMISLKNVWVSKLSVDELQFFISSNFDELKKENNKVTLEIKK